MTTVMLKRYVHEQVLQSYYTNPRYVLEFQLVIRDIRVRLLFQGSNQKSITRVREREETGFKLGWIQGVLIPCLLNIWGVMLFLRMPWIVSQSGILESTIIIVISTTICGLTTLSLSALCTNGEVKGGKKLRIALFF